jgi:hypothetical protein
MLRPSDYEKQCYWVGKPSRMCELVEGNQPAGRLISPTLAFIPGERLPAPFQQPDGPHPGRHPFPDE